MSEAVLQSLNVLKKMVHVNVYEEIHPSFLVRFLPNTWKNLPNFTNASLRFRSQWLLNKSLNVQPVTLDLCEHPYMQLLDISYKSWLCLEKVWGAIYWTHEIKKLVNRQDKEDLLRYLTQEIYVFVLKMGDLYAPILNTIPLLNVPDKLNERITSAGRFLLEYLWAQQPEPLIQRFVLKMPLGIPWNFRHVVDPVLQHKLMGLCKRLLMQLSEHLC